MTDDPPILVCLDSFKGTMTAAVASQAVADGIRAGLMGRRVHERFRERVRERPIADGGEGTIDAVSRAGWRLVSTVVSGPIGDRVVARFAVRDDVAVIELAEAAGLHLLAGRLEPMRASTYGVGELVLGALEHGSRTIVLAVGGSASTDGGTGMLAALGARFTDPAGQPIPPGGAGLAQLHRVDLSGLDPRIAATTFLLASDVDNPLLGPSGAAAVFAPQKGADADQVRLLERGLAGFAERLTAAGGHQGAAALAGAGAAGGTGFAALAALRARRISGAEFVLDQLGLRDELRRAALVVVGEGRLDEQTVRGKAPAVVARTAADFGVPVFAVAGQIDLTPAGLAELGITHSWSLAELAESSAEAMRRGPELLTTAGSRLAEQFERLWPDGPH